MAKVTVVLHDGGGTDHGGAHSTSADLQTVIVPESAGLIVNADDPVRPALYRGANAVTIFFNEPVEGFSIEDLRRIRDAGPNLLLSTATLATQDGVVWMLSGLGELTSQPGTYELSLNAATGGIEANSGGSLTKFSCAILALAAH